jgi:hydrogenase-4 component E
MIYAFLLGMIMFAYAMVITRRVTALIRSFRMQSLFLALLTFAFAYKTGNSEIFIVGLLLLALKVIAIPLYLRRLLKDINIDEPLGLFMNPLLSLVAALVFTFISALFGAVVLRNQDPRICISLIAAMTTVFIGFFIMVFRAKAITQIIGLLTMENGIFLLAAAITEGMPFFVEIAIFFDVFVCVIITGIFVYRINRLFTHIEVNRLTQLRG